MRINNLIVLAVVFTVVQSCSLIFKDEAPYTWNYIENCECYFWGPEDDFTYEWQGGTFDKYIHGVGTLKMFSNDSLVETKRFISENPVFYGAINNRKVYEFEGDYFVGDLENGLYEGQGVLLKSNGELYLGEFKKGKPDGALNFYRGTNLRYSGTWREGKYHDYGTQYLNDGAVKEGVWKNGEITQQEKVKLNFNQGEYYGFVKNNKPDGEGELITRNKDTIFGEWKNGKLDGYAEVLTEDYYVEGEWGQGMLNGHAYFIYPNSSVYNGDFLNGKKSGYGEYFYQDELYQGEWKDDKFHGFGHYSYADGKSYSGDWKEGIQDGIGTFETEEILYFGSLANGSVNGYGEVLYKNSGDIYYGDFEESIKSGTGTYLFEDGNSYQGEFVNDLFNGVGVFTFNDGTEYHGDFYNGKIYGEGSLYLIENDETLVFTAVWEGGNKFPDQASILFPNGDLYEGPIINGKPTAEGKWTTEEEREREESGEIIDVVQERSKVQRANDFYNKHQETFNKVANVLVYVDMVATAATMVTSAVFPPLAPVFAGVAVTARVGHVAVDLLNASSSSIDAKEHYDEGNIEEAIDAGGEAASYVAVAVASIAVPKAISKTAKPVSKAIKPIRASAIASSKSIAKSAVIVTKPVVKPLITKGRTFGKTFQVAISKNKTISKATLPARRLAKGGLNKQTLSVQDSKKLLLDKKNARMQILGARKDGGILSGNLSKAGVKNVKGTQAHHIIGNDSKCGVTKALLGLLSKYNIDINNAINGIRLPGGHKINNQRAYRATVARGQIHQGSHTCQYYDQVYEILKSTKNSDEFIEAMAIVKKKVYKGEIPLNRIRLQNDFIRTKRF